MMKYLTFATLLFASACSTEDTSSTDRAILPQTCAQDTDCPTGFECEIEVEHGVTTTFCQAHSADSQCPAGYELEVEHGQAFCKPHGGGSNDGGSNDGGTDDNGGSTGTGTTGSACTTDADCTVGLECELEHGAGTCQPHGGN
jgi:Cys-rich repeat protein